jgi:hypothetical protein
MYPKRVLYTKHIYIIYLTGFICNPSLSNRLLPRPKQMGFETESILIKQKTQNMKTISRFVAATALAVTAFTSAFAQADQTNLGSKCGCPLVSARPKVDITTMGSTTTARGITEFSSNVHLTCGKIYTITNKVYVPKPFTITIDPGVVIQGIYDNNSNNAAALIIERGAKIMAQGQPDCNIVMTTDQDNLDGTYSISNVSKWGGLIVMGIATNNLMADCNVPAAGNTYPNGAAPLCNGLDGEGHGEGFFAAQNVGNVFGTNPADPDGFTTPDDNDNSGIMTYLSLRHAGALVGGLAKGNEINGITLSSVGRGTTFNHIEVVSSGDDDVEYFGGTVDAKYIDKFDFDDGYRGRAQFLFSVAADSLNTGDLQSSDNGFECDADDQFGSTFATFPFQSNPNFWNATFISNGKLTATLDNTGHAGIMAKEMTGGQFHNCIFANFRSGVHFSEARSNSVLKGDAYDQWTNNADAYIGSWHANNGINYPVKNALVIQDNVIIKPAGPKYYGFTRGTLVQTTGATTGKFVKDFTGTGSVTQWATTTAGGQCAAVGLPNAADSVQFLTTDRNQVVASVPGITYNWSFNAGNTSFATPFHAVPLTNLTSASTPPADGFFTVVNYKGAFDAATPDCNWLSEYGLISLKSLGKSNPTDINQDGITDVNDFLLLLGKYGQLDK